MGTDIKADYKTGGIERSKRAIESYKQRIEALRRESKIGSNKERKDYYKKEIANLQEKIKWERSVIADWKKR